MLSVLDIFRVGVGPSSSHTVGPMRIAERFVAMIEDAGLLLRTGRIEVELRGSLALTGAGHGTPQAVVTGLMGHRPETFDAAAVASDLADWRATGQLSLGGKHAIAFAASDIHFAYDFGVDLHPNGMSLTAWDHRSQYLLSREFYSTGGGFVATREELTASVGAAVGTDGAPLPFASAADLLAICEAHDLSIADVVIANEDAVRPRAATLAGLDRIVAVMLHSIERGLATTGLLPGSLKVERRAAQLWRCLKTTHSNEPERLFDWLNVYAMAVNEENAAGGQVVTAPTNGAAGIIPALLRHYCMTDIAGRDAARRLLLTAGGIGLLYKARASISGAEMGCQGEVGVACSMGAAGLAAVWGGTPTQVTNAAEIGMEHNLGLTCDPVGGLVQIPCIERNAVGAVKAVNAARLALHRTAGTRVSLDQVIETMRQTGHDMSSKYKETSRGGLAVNVVEC